jgi:hypothetical protein
MRRSSVLSGLCALALAGGFLIADAVEAPSADAIYYGCSTYTYYPSWGAYNRQGLTNSTNPNRLYFYQDGKVGSSGAVAGKWVTGGRGVTYCGTDFFYSVDKNL